MNYKKLYHMLFNAVTDALRAIEKQDFGKAREGLMQAQRDCETQYVETEE